MYWYSSITIETLSLFFNECYSICTGYKQIGGYMHYICNGGCKGVAEKPGICQAEVCTEYQKELIACNCEDGRHEKVLKTQDKLTHSAKS